MGDIDGSIRIISLAERKPGVKAIAAIISLVDLFMSISFNSRKHVPQLDSLLQLSLVLDYPNTARSVCPETSRERIHGEYALALCNRGSLYRFLQVLCQLQESPIRTMTCINRQEVSRSRYCSLADAMMRLLSAWIAAAIGEASSSEFGQAMPGRRAIPSRKQPSCR